MDASDVLVCATEHASPITSYPLTIDLAEDFAQRACVPRALASLFVNNQLSGIAIADEIIDGIFIGGARAASADALAARRITCVINAAREVWMPQIEGVSIIRLDMADNPAFNPNDAWRRGFNAIVDARKSGQHVLVHCAAGISRSASVVAAYLMAGHQMTLVDALRLMKSRRPVVSPNIGFLVHLIALERAFYGVTSIPRRALHLHGGYAAAFYSEDAADAFISQVVGPVYAAWLAPG